MEIDLAKAVKAIYGKATFDLLYKEAVANSLDAGASEIKISIKEIKTKVEAKTKIDLEIKIYDNGVGFTDERFEKFCKLMSIDDSDKIHKGIGRLVFLHYFKNIEISSWYESKKKRHFKFDEKLTSADEPEIGEITGIGTEITMAGFKNARLRNKNDIAPSAIKSLLMETFYFKLAAIDSNNKNVRISIECTSDEIVEEDELDSAKLPPFTKKEIKIPFGDLRLEDTAYLYYSINDKPKTKLSVCFLIDERMEKIELFSTSRQIKDYSITFILKSAHFKGATNLARTEIKLNDQFKSDACTVLKKEITKILNENFPNDKISYQKESGQLRKRFPFLSDYINADKLWFDPAAKVIEAAQSELSRDKRAILTKENLTESEYKESIELAGRSLAEYITFRQYTINELRKISPADYESVSHNIITPQHETYLAKNRPCDIFSNNVWLVDDKFMTYSEVLSEQTISDLLKSLGDDNADSCIDRPDISIVFSDNPDKVDKFSVVIIELKKKGLKAGENIKIEVQLQNRAEKLAKLYPDRIELIWLYGITEINNEYKRNLKNIGYSQLYSKGNVFVNGTNIFVNADNNDSIPAMRTVMDYGTLLDDANARNQVFLEIIKNKFNKKNNEQD